MMFIPKHYRKLTFLGTVNLNRKDGLKCHKMPVQSSSKEYIGLYSLVILTLKFVLIDTNDEWKIMLNFCFVKSSWVDE